MGSIRKIRRDIEVVVQSDKNGDEVEYAVVNKLVPFDPPVCGVCHQHMRNIQTVNGQRKFQCVTWSCTNKRMYDEGGNLLGQSARNA